MNKLTSAIVGQECRYVDEQSHYTHGSVLKGHSRLTIYGVNEDFIRIKVHYPDGTHDFFDADHHLVLLSTPPADVPTDEEIKERRGYWSQIDPENKYRGGGFHFEAGARWMRDLMRERAKREAVEFAEWCEAHAEKYRGKSIKKEYCWVENKGDSGYVTADLYDAFLASRKEGNR